MRRLRRNSNRATAAPRLEVGTGDHVWFTRPSCRTPHAVALIDHGVIRACSSGAVVVQTRSTHDGPSFHIVPRHAVHGLAGRRANLEREKATPPAPTDHARPINNKE